MNKTLLVPIITLGAGIVMTYVGYHFDEWPITFPYKDTYRFPVIGLAGGLIASVIRMFSDRRQQELGIQLQTNDFTSVALGMIGGVLLGVAVNVQFLVDRLPGLAPSNYPGMWIFFYAVGAATLIYFIDIIISVLRTYVSKGAGK